MKKLLIALALLICARHAHAQFVTFTDRPTWLTNTSSTSLVNFNAFPTEDHFGNAFPHPPVHVGDFMLSATTGTAAIDRSPFLPNLDIDGTTFAFAGIATGESVFFDFDVPITALGVDFRDLRNAPEHDTDLFVNGNALNLPLATDGEIRFFGFTSAVPFTQLEIRGQGPGDIFGFDNVEYQLAPVPEPSTYAMLAMATFGGVVYWRRNRRPTHRGS